MGEREAKIGRFDRYAPLLVKIVKFFRTGMPPVSEQETIEIYAFMQADELSKSRGGRRVEIAEVLELARRKIPATSPPLCGVILDEDAEQTKGEAFDPTREWASGRGSSAFRACGRKGAGRRWRPVGGLGLGHHERDAVAIVLHFPGQSGGEVGDLVGVFRARREVVQFVGIDREIEELRAYVRV